MTLKLKRPRLKRPQGEYILIHQRHPGWSALFFLNGLWVWLPIAQLSDDGHKIAAYIVVVVSCLIGTRLACVRPWFTWE